MWIATASAVALVRAMIVIAAHVVIVTVLVTNYASPKARMTTDRVTKLPATDVKIDFFGGAALIGLQSAAITTRFDTCQSGSLYWWG
jgi:hypothetical protein